MRKKNNQIALFDDASEAADLTKYEFIQVTPQRKNLSFCGVLSFDKLSHYVRENIASGIVVHPATSARTNARSGYVIIKDFPIVNSFSPAKVHPS